MGKKINRKDGQSDGWKRRKRQGNEGKGKKETGRKGALPCLGSSHKTIDKLVASGITLMSDKLQLQSVSKLMPSMTLRCDPERKTCHVRPCSRNKLSNAVTVGCSCCVSTRSVDVKNCIYRNTDEFTIFICNNQTFSMSLSNF